jgi:YegS/Rv2252/BmrU family lipid kinase
VEVLRTELERRGTAVELYATRAAGDATRELASRPDAAELVIAAGGDGTVNEVVNGLVDWQQPRLGVLPTGSANVLSLELGLPRDPVAAAEVMLEGRMLPVRPSRVGERRFLLWVGAGIDAAIVNTVDLGLKRRIGRLAYVLSTFARLREYGTTRFEVMAGGTRLEGASVLVSRIRHYAGPFRIAEESALTGDELRVVVLESASRRALLGHLIALLRSRLEGRAGVVTRLVREATLSASQPATVQIDGDPGPALPLRCRVEESVLPVMVPPR